MKNVEGSARVHLIIEGRVQGVFFRASALEQASRLGITGWVRNRPDGAVEIVAEGKRKQIDKLVEWCHRGPPSADVHRVRIKWGTFQNEFQSFRMER